MRKLLLLAAFMLACGGDDNTAPGDGGGDGNGNGNTFTVSIVNNQFNPSSVSVPVGSTVTWQWNSGGVAHNVTFEDGPSSGTKGSGTYPRTFTATGDYAYICTIHSGMAGTVSVTATATGGTGGGGGGSYP